MSAVAQTDHTGRSELYGWLVWGLGASFFAYAFLHRVAPSVMYDMLMRDFAATAAVFGNLSACYFYAYGAAQLPVGLLIDRFGPRLLLSLGALVCCGGTLLFAAATDLASAYAGRLLVGAGTGVVFISALTLAAIWLPPRRFAMATGLTQTAGMMGGVLIQAPLGIAVQAFGWRPTMYAAAAVALLFAATIWLLARDGVRGPAKTAPGALPFRAAAKRALTNRQTWLAAVYSGCSSGPMLIYVVWGVAFLMQAKGLSREAAALAASSLLFGWAVAAPFAGWASDRMGRRKPLLIGGMVVSTVVWLPVIALHDLALPFVYALLFLAGASASVMALIFAVGREVNPPEVRGMATGIVNLASIGTGALLQPLVGLLLDLQWDGTLVDGARVFGPEAFMWALLPCPIVSLIALAAALMLRETYCRPVAG